MHSTNVYVLKEDINSPQFIRTIPKGTVYTQFQIKKIFPYLYGEQFDKWFEVSKDMHLENCRVIKSKTND